MRTTWWSRRAALLHLTAVVVVAGCIAACWWQVTRALSGNELSWAYVFEWPVFAAYALYLWWKLLHEPFRTAPAGAADDPATDPPDGPRAPAEPPSPEDEELAAYNRYLAELHAAGEQKRW